MVCKRRSVRLQVKGLQVRQQGVWNRDISVAGPALRLSNGSVALNGLPDMDHPGVKIDVPAIQGSHLHRPEPAVEHDLEIQTKWVIGSHLKDQCPLTVCDPAPHFVRAGGAGEDDAVNGITEDNIGVERSFEKGFVNPDLSENSFIVNPLRFL